jgi:hypothetical protein
MILKKVISGGQCGVDRIALECARDAKLLTGGTAPPHFMTIRGKAPELGYTYGLTALHGELSIGDAYRKRSMLNVDASDGTLAFRFHKSCGTDCTIHYARTKVWRNVVSRSQSTHKPLLVVADLLGDPDEIAHSIQDFLNRNKIETLNVCGHRDVSKEEGDTIRSVLALAFNKTR